ncbi:hypothetical protein [Vulcanisaeta thermophila]|uniref:hypothetical protein n=1 Tax=Vulcanisaeta thermophila TaxID=867917 RepID=UPI000853E0D1|nr:hypothetical protein [Vulcanisaeta thermophila]
MTYLFPPIAVYELTPSEPGGEPPFYESMAFQASYQWVYWSGPLPPYASTPTINITVLVYPTSMQVLNVTGAS